MEIQLNCVGWLSSLIVTRFFRLLLGWKSVFLWLPLVETCLSVAVACGSYQKFFWSLAITSIILTLIAFLFVPAALMDLLPSFDNCLLAQNFLGTLFLPSFCNVRYFSVVFLLSGWYAWLLLFRLGVILRRQQKKLQL